MKIMFIMPGSQGRYGKPSSPPVGIAYLATFLKARGHEVGVMDLRVEKKGYDHISAIKAFGPETVGVSFMSNGYKESYTLIDEIKTKLGVTVIIGGAHPSTLREKVLEECGADYAVYGEGEFTMLEFLEQKAPPEIKGLVWRDGENIVVNPPREPLLDLDSLPFPDHGMFKLDRYGRKRISLNTSRGCPHLCTYCAVDLVIGRRFRARSPENVVDEIEYWYRRGYRNFGFNDSTFTEDMKRAGRIAEELIRRNIEIEWDLRTGIRVDRVNKELLRKLKQAGCNFIAFGIESIDPEVIQLMRKKTTFEMAEKAVRDARASGLGVGGFFMIGTPGDTYKKFKKTYDFADQEIFDEVRFYNTEPYPGTAIYEWIRANGRFLAEPEEYLNSRSRWDEEPIFETDRFAARERKKAFNEGEFLVAKKLAIKVLGRKLGVFVYSPCRNRMIRKVVLFMGFRMAPLIFKFMSLKNNSSAPKESIG